MPDFSGFSALSFDCYGTLIDWERGIAAALRSWAHGAGLNLTDEDLIAAHARHETDVQQARPTAPYPTILATTLERIGAEFSTHVPPHVAQAYGASVAVWPAFSDSAESLARLGGAFTLIILSNVDRESFAHSNQLLGVEFDLIVTAEEVGAYKPDHAGFHLMFDRARELGIEPQRILHVAESLYHDHEPALQLGMQTVWIHRRHAKSGYGATATPRGPVKPTWRYESLSDFADEATG